MSAPIRAGWYRAKYDKRWEVVYVCDKYKRFDVWRAGIEMEFDVPEFAEWGERVERKEDGK